MLVRGALLCKCRTAGGHGWLLNATRTLSRAGNVLGDQRQKTRPTRRIVLHMPGSRIGHIEQSFGEREGTKTMNKHVHESVPRHEASFVQVTEILDCSRAQQGQSEAQVVPRHWPATVVKLVLVGRQQADEPLAA